MMNINLEHFPEYVDKQKAPYIQAQTYIKASQKNQNTTIAR